MTTNSLHLDPARAAATSRKTVLVTGLCWIAMFAEGYDMSALGAVMPAILKDGAWNLTVMEASFLASAALVGMFFGGYGFGAFADRFGRKLAFLAAVTLFSSASMAGAFAPSPVLFAVARFLCGVGVGGIVPICSALIYEFSVPDRANRQYALMYSGYTLGIFGASLTAYGLLEAYGWRLIVALGGLPLLLLPVFARLLPESVAFLLAHSRDAEAAATAREFGIALPESNGRSADMAEQKAVGLRFLFNTRYRRATFGFWLATFFGMVVLYGLTTWLPQIMKSAGYDLGPAILFLGVFALASSGGGILLGWLADKIGRKLTISVAFLFGSLAILGMGVPQQLYVTYAIVALAGMGTVSAAVMVTSYLSAYFPAKVRATAVGTCLSFSRFGAVCGPLLGGVVATYHLPLMWNFLAYSGAALLAGLSILLPPTRVQSA